MGLMPWGGRSHQLSPCRPLIGLRFEHVLQELPGRLSVSRRNELSKGELGRLLDAHKEIELAFSRVHLGDIDVEEPE